MTGGYVLVAGILLYIFLLQKLDSPSMSPLKAAIILVGGYWLLASVVAGMLYDLFGLPMLNVVSLEVAVTAATQLAVAAGIFYKVDQSGDEYLSYALWGGLGLALIFFITPQLVASLL